MSSTKKISSEKTEISKEKKPFSKDVTGYDFRYSVHYKMNGVEYDMSPSNVISILKGVATHWCFQLEKGETGYEHYQGRLRLHHKKTKSAALKLFGDSPPNYFEPTSEKEYQRGSFNYQMKVDTRTGGPWTDKSEDIPMETLDQLIPFEKNGPFKWQQKCLDIIATKPDLRKVYIIVNPAGSKGKSSFVNNLLTKRLGYFVPSINDHIKLIQACCNIVESIPVEPGCYRRPNCFLLDIPKSMGHNRKELSNLYRVIEELKDGRVVEFRYKYRMILFHTPHIFVYTNEYPDIRLLSEDRFCIYTVTEDFDLKMEDLHKLPGYEDRIEDDDDDDFY